jgi:nitrate reductase NapE component
VVELSKRTREAVLKVLVQHRNDGACLEELCRFLPDIKPDEIDKSLRVLDADGLVKNGPFCANVTDQGLGYCEKKHEAIRARLAFEVWDLLKIAFGGVIGFIVGRITAQ